MASRPLTFRPRFTLMLVYVAGFFLLYALLFVASDLAPLLGSAARELPPDELQQRAHDAAREAMRGKAVLALLASLATVGLGTWRNFLPGVR